jgi:nitroimidazol reductase NimA-like FMN-containing flavoprotein (pyridoxamine 5'-phosphate oxidase superfamily)
MDGHANSAERLTRAQCLDLLRSTGIGRIAYSQRAMPAIVTVDYAVIDEALVLRIDEGAPELAPMRNAVVAFQADHSGGLDGRSWSVTCVGNARAVDNPATVVALAGAGEWSSAGSPRPAFLRMDPELLEGRLFRALPRPGGDRPPLTVTV